MDRPCPSDPSQWRVLVVDDDPLFLEIARVALQRVGAEVWTEADAARGVNRAIEDRHNLVLLDLMMPGVSGEEVLRFFKPLSLRVPVVVVSASGEADAAARTRDLGACGFIAKPIDALDLPARIQDILRNSGDTGEADGPPAWDPLVRWVFGDVPATRIRRLAACAILAALVGVLASLVLT